MSGFPCAMPFKYRRFSFRPWMDVMINPSPESSSSAAENEYRPARSPYASYRTTDTRTLSPLCAEFLNTLHVLAVTYGFATGSYDNRRARGQRHIFHGLVAHAESLLQRLDETQNEDEMSYVCFTLLRDPRNETPRNSSTLYGNGLASYTLNNLRSTLAMDAESAKQYAWRISFSMILAYAENVHIDDNIFALVSSGQPDVTVVRAAVRVMRQIADTERPLIPWPQP